MKYIKPLRLAIAYYSPRPPGPETPAFSREKAKFASRVVLPEH